MPAGPASDLWAVGATLYTAVEGRPPYDRDGIVPILTAAAMEDPDPFERAGPLVTVVFVEGSGRDPDLRAFIDKIESERRTGTAHMAHHIATTFGLRPGLTEAEAADVLWVLTSPELVDRFTRRRGWTLDRFEQWQTRTMADALVGPA